MSVALCFDLVSCCGHQTQSCDWIDRRVLGPHGRKDVPQVDGEGSTGDCRKVVYHSASIRIYSRAGSRRNKHRTLVASFERHLSPVVRGILVSKSLATFRLCDGAYTIPSAIRKFHPLSATIDAYISLTYVVSCACGPIETCGNVESRFEATADISHLPWYRYRPPRVFFALILLNSTRVHSSNESSTLSSTLGSTLGRLADKAPTSGIARVGASDVVTGAGTRAESGTASRPLGLDSFVDANVSQLHGTQLDGNPAIIQGQPAGTHIHITSGQMLHDGEARTVDDAVSANTRGDAALCPLVLATDLVMVLENQKSARACGTFTESRARPLTSLLYS